MAVLPVALNPYYYVVFCWFAWAPPADLKPVAIGYGTREACGEHVDQQNEAWKKYFDRNPRLMHSSTRSYSPEIERQSATFTRLAFTPRGAVDGFWVYAADRGDDATGVFSSLSRGLPVGANLMVSGFCVPGTLADPRWEMQ